MDVQSVNDSGAVKGTLDLQDKVIVGPETIIVEDYLKAGTQYDTSESPNIRLAHVLQLREGSRLPISTDVIAFVNEQTGLWNASHPVCPKGMTFVAAGEHVPNAFCVDNEATQMVSGKDPTWQDAKDFCEDAGKFLLSYEQHVLAANSTSSDVVSPSYDFEWVLNSNGDDRRGQVGGFFSGPYRRYSYDGNLNPLNHDNRYELFAFRCGDDPSFQ